MAERELGFSSGTALVTGGSGGLCRVICRRLAEAGSDVALTYHRNAAAADEVAEGIRVLGRRTAVFALDSADEAASKTCIDRVTEEFGSLHMLVYASGPDIPMTHISKTPPAQFRSFMPQDTVGFYNLVHTAIPHLHAWKGSIVALHTADLRRYPERDILSVAPKAAVEVIIRGVAKEEGCYYGIRANGVSAVSRPACTGVCAKAATTFRKRWNSRGATAAFNASRNRPVSGLGANPRS